MLTPEGLPINIAAISPAALVWLGYAPNVAALFTCIWFIYRFVAWLSCKLKKK